MTAATHALLGRWRIVEADLWDRDHLDLCGPATLVIGPRGDGEIAFGALQASLDADYGPDEIGFTASRPSTPFICLAACLASGRSLSREMHKIRTGRRPQSKQ